MAINQLSTSNTFTEWLSATSLLISNVNSLTDNTGGGFVANSSIFLQGTAASLNVRTLANINTLQANTANISNTSFAGSNVTIQLDLVVGRNVSTPTLYANNIFQGGVNVSALALQIVPAFTQANAAFIAANSSGVYANGAFVRANNSLNANVGGTITGNVVISNGNLSVSNGATEVFNVRNWSTSGLPSTSNSTGTVTVTGGVGIKGNVYAHEVYDNGFRILFQANAAFAQANIGLIQANAAFIAANSSGVYANGAFVRANNALNANVGGTITGNVVISGSNLSVSNGATELFNVRSWGTGLPSTSNSTGTVTVIGGMGIRGNVFAQEVYDNGFRILFQANAAFAQANVSLVQANVAFIQANAAFAQSNVALTQANAAFIRANNALNANVGGTITGNTVISGSNLVVSNGATEIFNVRSHSTTGLPAISNSTGTVTITGGIGIQGNVFADGIYDGGVEVLLHANAAFARANISFIQANAAFAQANIALTQANAAFIRANNSLSANVGGTITGNTVISGANLVVSNGATELFNVRSHSTTGLPATSNSTGTVVVIGGVGIQGNVYSDGVFDNGLRIIVQANAAFAQASIGLTQANAAFITANAAFAQSNIALTQANAAFLRANNSLSANVGGTITGNTVISGSNLVVSNGATELFNVRSWGVGLPATSNSTGTLTIIGGAGIRGNVYSDGIYDNGLRVIVQANAAFAQANIALTQANAAFAQANVAFAQSNIALTQANAAFIRANNSLSANVGGTITGNTVISGANLVVSNGATELFNVRSWGTGLPATSNSTGTITILGGVGVRGNVYSDGIYDNNIRVLVQANSAFAQSNIALTQANAAFAQANISLTQANVAFAQSNIALTQANAAFAQANIAFSSTGFAFNQANAAFLRANNSLDANNGGVVTADVTIRSATGIRAEVASTQDAVVLRGRSGGTGSFAATLTPATLDTNRTVTIPNEDFTLGFRNVPSSGADKTTNYTLVTTDVGKHVKVGTGGSITIPNATFADGDIVTLFNNTASSITITCSISTAYIASFSNSVTSMSLSTRGIATVMFTGSTSCVVVGSVF